MKRLLTLILLLAVGLVAWAQRTGVREEVLSSWNKASGLDNVYDMTPKALTPAPRGYEAVYIGHYGRHGSRYAYTDKAYTLLLNLLAEGQKADNLTPYGEELLQALQPFWDHVHYRVGDLTPLGWAQHQYIASTMVKSFPSAFGKGAKIDACSSASERSLVSMASFLTALGRLAPAAEIYAHESQLDANATRPNMGRNPLKYAGPKLKVPYEESMEDFFLRRFPEYRTVLSRLFKDPDAALGSHNPWEVFFHLYMFVAGMNSLPEEARVDVSGLVTPQEYATLWETDNYARFCEYYPYQRPNSSILVDFVQKADAALAQGQRGAHLRFGHDHVLMSLLMAMDIDGFATVPEHNDDLVYWFQSFRSPMATNLQLVYFQPRKGRSGETLVKVLLNGEEVRVGDLEPVSGPYYKWEDVRAFLLARVARFTYQPQPGEWTVTPVAPGITYRSFSGLDPVSGSAQQVFVADWDMSVPGYSFHFGYTPDRCRTSDVLKEKGAVVAMNAAYEISSVVLKVDGKLLYNMPNNTIVSTGVPNWKNEGAVYTDGHGVRIGYEGKGRTREQLRSFYARSTEANIFSSAPMLIENHRPVGLSFAGYHSSTAALKKLEYEDPARHQGMRHPRTAIAVTDDNHLLLVVVDGRRGGISEGMSARELTAFLQANFNPRDALNMDGGGSSTLCIDGEGDPATHVVNYPTDNNRYDHRGERRLHSFFYLVKE